MKVSKMNHQGGSVCGGVCHLVCISLPPLNCHNPPPSYEQKIKALYQVPDHLEVKKKEQSEEMLSNQMLSGIPEVDLGLE